MDRYEYVMHTKSSTGARMYTTSRYPILEPTESDTYIYTRVGMRLDNLAFKYYGDAGLWWIIALANNLGKGTLIVPLKQQLRIPSGDTVTSITRLLNDKQSNG